MDNNNPTSANPAPETNPVAGPAPEPVAQAEPIQPTEIAQPAQPVQAAQPAPSAPVNPVPPVQPAAPKAKSGGSVGILIGIIVAVVVCGVVALILLAPWKNLGGKSGDDNKKDDESGKVVDGESYNTKGNCKFYECLSLVTKDSTAQEVETAFGFAPEVETEDDGDKKYTWTFDDKHSITMNTIDFSGKTSTVNIRLNDYVKEELEQDGVIFDNVSEIKANLNKGDGVNYEQFKEYMGGVDGILTEVGSWNKYEWRSTSAEGYMSGSFGESGKCMFMGGLTY